MNNIGAHNKRKEFKDESSLDDSKYISKFTIDDEVVFLTLIKQVKKHINYGDKIIVVGDCIGDYGVYFAEKGYDVTVVEYIQSKVDSIKEKINSNIKIEVISGNPVDLHMIKDKSYDIVLWLGPGYHFSNKIDREMSIAEMKRICKLRGKMFFKFMNNDMHIATEVMCNNEFYLHGYNYNKDTFKVLDFPFKFYTLESVRTLVKEYNLEIKSQVALDGLTNLLADKINKMDDKSFKLWLNYHFYCCEKIEFLGASNNVLLVLEQNV